MERIEEVIPSEEARRRLPQMLRALRGKPARSRFVIGRHRRPEAVLIGLADYERLRAAADAEEGRRDPAELLRAHREQILRLAAQRGASDVRVFGSVARGDAGPGSDIDLLVRLDPDRSLLDLGGLVDDLEELLGRRVDVVSENGLRSRFGERLLREAVSL